MYAFTTEQQAAWRWLYARLKKALNPQMDLAASLRFETDAATLHHRRLLLGHTCGYPLVTTHQHLLRPLCVPVFAFDGCDGVNYCSVVITNRGQAAQSLADVVGQRLVINGVDSNSGMNMLRDQLLPLSPDKPFFDTTWVSGTHLDSVRAVASGKADVAAIDCITWGLLQHSHPAWIDSVKLIGYSRQTVGLPLVYPIARQRELAQCDLLSMLNEALSTMPTDLYPHLPIKRFEPISIQDYQSIDDMQRRAASLGRLPLAL